MFIVHLPEAVQKSLREVQSAWQSGELNLTKTDIYEACCAEHPELQISSTSFFKFLGRKGIPKQEPLDDYEQFEIEDF